MLSERVEFVNFIYLTQSSIGFLNIASLPSDGKPKAIILSVMSIVKLTVGYLISLELGEWKFKSLQAKSKSNSSSWYRFFLSDTICRNFFRGSAMLVIEVVVYYKWQEVLVFVVYLKSPS
jgi:hypothetical protein